MGAQVTRQELLEEARRNDKMPGSVIHQEDLEAITDQHTGASVEATLLVIEGAGHGLSYEVWEFAKSPDDEDGHGTYACVLDGYGVGEFGKEMNFREYNRTMPKRRKEHRFLEGEEFCTDCGVHRERRNQLLCFT